MAEHTSETAQAAALLRDLRRELEQLRSENPAAPQHPEAAAETPPDGGTQLGQSVKELRERWEIKPQPFRSHTPIVGPLIVLFRRLWNNVSTRWYVDPILQQQVEFNGSVMRALQQMEMLLRSFHEDLPYMREERAEYDHMSLAMTRSLAQLELVLSELDARIAATQDGHYPRALQDLEHRIRRLEGQQGTPVPAHIAPGQPATAPESLDLDYFNFELRFRGAPEQLMARQEQYLSHLAGLGPVVDLGCGRGELLALLREHQTDARGVDSDAGMVAYCRAQGLDVAQGDLLDYLAGQADDGLGAVFTAQTIEHLPPPALVRLFHLTYRKLAPGGVFIAETINPMCLLALASNYTLDLSHQQPVHPDTAAFIAESAGFADVAVRYTSPVADSSKLQLLEPAENATAEPWRTRLNQNLQKLNELLFTYQDYALIARKPGTPRGQS